MREKLWSYADGMFTLVRSFKIDSKEVEGAMTSEMDAHKAL